MKCKECGTCVDKSGECFECEFIATTTADRQALKANREFESAVGMALKVFASEGNVTQSFDLDKRSEARSWAIRKALQTGKPAMVTKGCYGTNNEWIPESEYDVIFPPVMN